MKKTMLRLAMAQINTVVGDIEGNKRKIIDYIRQAYEKKSDIVIFPELSITGYPPEDLLFKKSFIDLTEKAMEDIRNTARDIVAIIGVPHRIKQYLFNAAAVLYNEKIIDIYHKTILPNYGVFDEKRYFSKGSKDTKVYKLNNILFGINICEDIWDEHGPAQSQVIECGASLIIALNSSPYHIGKFKQRKNLLCLRAKKLSVHIAYVNLVGGQDELVFDGQSMIVSPSGNITALGNQFEEEMIFTDCEIPDALNKNNKVIIIPVNKKNLKSKTKTIKPENTNKPFKQLSEMAEIYMALVTGTRDYIYKNGFSKVVIGLSGGIDSAITAVIAKDALGAENVTGIFMPSQYSSKLSEKDALDVAKKLNIGYLRIPIQNIHKTYLKGLKNIFKKYPEDTTEENLQARIRGNILMALSNKFGWLVLTTGNKSEISVGYATLYGDMAGAFSVLKDVFKTLVYKLVDYRNASLEFCEKNVISDSIIKKAPTAELRFDQKDTDSLPPYEILDPILQAYVEEDKKIEEIINSGFDEKIIKEVMVMVDKSEYKRRQSPPGIKITARAFGKDRRMPIINRFKT